MAKRDPLSITFQSFDKPSDVHFRTVVESDDPEGDAKEVARRLREIGLHPVVTPGDQESPSR